MLVLMMMSVIIFALVQNPCTAPPIGPNCGDDSDYLCAAQPIKPNGGDDASDYLCAAPPIEPIFSHPSPQIPPRAVPPSTHTEVQAILDRILDIVFSTRGATDDDEDEDDGDWDVLWKVSPISLSALAYPPSIRPAADIA